MRYQHCVLLPISLVLIGAGLVTLLLFGIGNLEPYTHTKNFRTATCTVLQSNMSGMVSCKHQDTSDPHVAIYYSSYPCLTIRVNYTEHVTQYDILDYDEDLEETISASSYNTTNGTEQTTVVRRTFAHADGKEDELVSEVDVMLYDTYDSWTMQHTGRANSTCSMHVCNENPTENQEEVDDFLEDYGTVGYSFRCHFNPHNTVEVFVDVVSGNSVMHALVWPALAMGFGLFLLVVVAFLSCEVWICRNPKRARRRMEGQTYHLASYREGNREVSRQGWREGSRERDEPRTPRSKRRAGDGNNNSRLPNLSAAADIIRKWSYRNRSDRQSSSSSHATPSGTNKSSQSYGGESSNLSAKQPEKQFSTT